jgi:hypothetical protein
MVAGGEGIEIVKDKVSRCLLDSRGKWDKG